MSLFSIENGETMKPLIEAIHAHCASTGRRFVLSAAGAGSTSISRLLSVPGASQTVLEGQVPYGKRSFDELLRPHADSGSPHRVRGYVSAEGAVRLAAAANERCSHLIGLSNVTPEAAGETLLKPVGAAVTSAVVTSGGPGSSKNLTYSCVVGGGDLRRSSNTATLYATRLKQAGSRTREEEENLCGNILIAAMGESIGDDGLTIATGQQKPHHRQPTQQEVVVVKPSEWISEVFKPLKTIDLCEGTEAASKIDIRVPASLPEDTVVRATVPLPSPLQRLLPDSEPTYPPFACGASAPPASSPFAHLPPLAKQVAGWLPPVSHIVFVPAVAAALAAATPAVPAPAGAAAAGAGAAPVSASVETTVSCPSSAALADLFLILPNVPLYDHCAGEQANHQLTARSSSGVGSGSSTSLPTVLVVPGSFNPVHKGHVGMAEAAKRVLGRMWQERLGVGVGSASSSSSSSSASSSTSSSPSASASGPSSSSSSPAVPVPALKIAFELSAVNVDKPPLSKEEVERRVMQFAAPTSFSSSSSSLSSPALGGKGFPVVVTRAPRFFEKGRLFPRGVAFVLGFDTVTRLLDPKYYDNDQDKMVEVLLGLKLNGTRIFVAGRAAAGTSTSTGNGNSASTAASAFLTYSRDLLAKGKVPKLLSEGLFVEIPEDEFREDISSTELRAKAAAAEAVKAKAAGEGAKL